MKKILLIISTFSLALGVELLQEGAYPECSYVIVTADGWRMHKNYQGRILSMKAPNLHDTKLGKYSFDKFGNLIPYTDCQTIEMSTNKKTIEKEIEVEVELDLGKLFEKIDLSVYAGGGMGFGDNLPGQFSIGMTYGADIKILQCPFFDANKINLSLSSMSSAWDGATTNYDYTWEWAEAPDWSYNWENSSDAENAKLSATGVFLGYTVNLGKLSMTPSIGMLTQKITDLPFLLNAESEITTQSFDGNDNAVKLDVGYNFGKISIYAGGTYSLTSNFHWANTEQPAIYLMGGLKYNF